nr:DNA (cytosine-5-)-methyltransferase [Priestia megaterium]
MSEINYEKVPFKYVSLFSGIGGFEQALNKLGGTCIMASEIDKFANQSYEALYGHQTVGDITKVAAEDIPDHDILVGGFPCQAFSVAGKRLGFEEARGTLFFEIARLAATKQPKIMLLENVKGLVGHDKGKTLDTIVQTLNDIGYTVDFDVLNSKYFGVPQNRERIFIVAVRDDLIEEKPWVTGGRTDVVAKGKKRISALAGVKTFNFDWPTQEAVTARLRDILEPVVDEKYYLSEEKTAALVAKLRDREIEALESRNPSDVNAINSPEVITKNQNGTRIKPNDEPMSALTVQDRHGIIEAAVVNYSRKEGIGKERDVALCLSSSDWRGLNRNQLQNAVFETSPQYRIRKLTPLECWRLQGFSDEAHETAKAAGISDSQRYKQAGNAVTVNVIEAIGRNLLPLINE